MSKWLTHDNSILNKTRGNSRLTHMTTIGNKSHKAPSLSKIGWEEAEISTGRARARASASASAHQWYYLGDPPPEVARGGSTNFRFLYYSLASACMKTIKPLLSSDQESD